jgi:hypothetical protein
MKNDDERIFYVLGSMEKNREFLCPPKSRYP